MKSTNVNGKGWRRGAYALAASTAVVAAMLPAAGALAGDTPSAPNVEWKRADTTATSVTAHWEAVSGANHYLCNGVTIGNTLSCTREAGADEIVNFWIQACNDSTCSSAASVRAATNPLAPTNLRVGKITQPSGPGTDRCVMLRWDDVTAVDHYWVNIDKSGAPHADVQALKAKKKVCGLGPQGSFDFTVAAANRLERAPGLVGTGRQPLLGAASSKSRTVKAVPPVPGNVSVQANDAYESTPTDVSLSMSVTKGLPTGAKFIRFHLVDRAGYLDSAAGKANARYTGLQWNQTYKVEAAACSEDGCSAYNTPTSGLRAAPMPMIWDVAAGSSGQVTFTNLGMRGSGGYSYRVKWCNRTAVSGCDPNTDSTGRTDWVTDRNGGTLNLTGFKSGAKYAFMVVESAETDGTSPKTYSTNKALTVK